ncbi:hypothetical protein BMEGG_06225 [Priestia megaterium]
MNHKLRKIFMVYFFVLTVPFAIIFFTDYLVQLSNKD